MRFLAAGLLCLTVGAVHAEDGPTPAMMAPIRALASCMAKALPADCALPFAHRGVTIQENFAPFIYAGTDVVERWRTGFITHLQSGGDQNLEFKFGPPQDFDRSAGRVYFTLPTVWTGVSRGRHFEETGAWSFVLVESSANFLVLGYSWGVTDLREIKQ